MGGAGPYIGEREPPARLLQCPPDRRTEAGACQRQTTRHILVGFAMTEDGEIVFNTLT
jgi:hypothetical protein